MPWPRMSICLPRHGRRRRLLRRKPRAMSNRAVGRVPRSRRGRSLRTRCAGLRPMITTRPRHARALGRGKLVPQASLDLHGMTLAAAERAVAIFLMPPWRVISASLIAGAPAPAGGRMLGGRIRAEFVGWLNRATSAAWCGVRPAHSRHGGGGAFYVLLRRRSSASSRSCGRRPSDNGSAPRERRRVTGGSPRPPGWWRRRGRRRGRRWAGRCCARSRHRSGSRRTDPGQRLPDLPLESRADDVERHFGRVERRRLAAVKPGEHVLTRGAGRVVAGDSRLEIALRFCSRAIVIAQEHRGDALWVAATRSRP